MAALRRPGIPITVIGGYLGAGKTTLLNRLLTGADRRIAVLVNDFGAINIDAELVQSRDGDMLDLTNGCVCCGLSGELMFTLAGLRDRGDPPEHVVVEASGIADPAAIAAYGDTPGYSRDAVIAVVDAETLRAHASDPRISSHVLSQLRTADLVVLNKTDLVSPAELAETRAWLAELVPFATIVEASFGEVPTDLLLGVPENGSERGPADAEGGRGHAPIHADDQGHESRHEGHGHQGHGHEGHGHDHEEHGEDDGHPSYDSWSWAGESPLDGKGLCEVLPELPDGVMRGKGILHLREEPENRFILQLVGRRWSIKREGTWSDEEPGSRLVLIGLPGSLRPEELDTTMTGLTVAGDPQQA